ncbi:hypothetical protein [Micromonospora sp. NPDC049497]|uniref:hypothetical protein n=1 Tax=Micromonospora sp. NPDC049497 TaxID=3364273 RepID=UPI0037959E56
MARYAVLLGAAVGAGFLAASLSAGPVEAADRAGAPGAVSSGVVDALDPLASGPARPARTGDGPSRPDARAEASVIPTGKPAGSGPAVVDEVAVRVGGLVRDVARPVAAPGPEDRHRSRGQPAVQSVAPGAAESVTRPDRGTPGHRAAPVRLPDRPTPFRAPAVRPSALPGLSDVDGAVAPVVGTVAASSSAVAPIAHTALTTVDVVLTPVTGLVRGVLPVIPICPGGMAPPNHHPGVPPPAPHPAVPPPAASASAVPPHGPGPARTAAGPAGPSRTAAGSPTSGGTWTGGTADPDPGRRPPPAGVQDGGSAPAAPGIPSIPADDCAAPRDGGTALAYRPVSAQGWSDAVGGGPVPPWAGPGGRTPEVGTRPG